MAFGGWSKGDKMAIKIKKQDYDKVYFSSDLHFSHANIILYCNRPFQTIDEMNKTIIEHFNKTLDKESILFLLGDIALGVDLENIKELLESIKCKEKHLIIGNHDTDRKIDLYKENNLFNSISYADLIKTDYYSFYLSHYPALMERHNKLFNLSGHTHIKNNEENIKNNIYNVGVDAHNFYPVSLNNIINDIKERR